MKTDSNSTLEIIEKVFPDGNDVQGNSSNLSHSLNQSMSLSKQKPSSLIYLPPNIRHKFGSHVCDMLLSDKDLLSSSIERVKARSTPQRLSKKESISSLPVDLESNYEILGQTIRYNIFPGLTLNHKVSHTHKEFNKAIHQKRVPNPDTFHHHRDDLITWSEQNILRERTKRAWEEKYPLGGSKQ